MTATWEQYKKYDKDFVANSPSISITYNDNNMNTDEFIKNNDKRNIRNTNTGEEASNLCW